MTKRIYFENLDGLRFLCFLSVFFFHSFYTESDVIRNSSLYGFIKWEIFGNGNLGVNFFFVLSGFLITYLLIEEKKINKQITLKNFWIRRVLRIWPLFYFCVFFGFVIFPLLKSFFGQTPNETATFWMYLTFLNNFDFIQNGLPDASILGVLWSVAIEEQFYLIWPVILFLLPIRHHWIAFSCVILISIIFRSIYDVPLLHEHHTLSCIGDMAIGALGAWLMQEKETVKRFVVNLNKYTIILIYILFAIVFFFRDEILFETHMLRTFERPGIAFLMLLIILEQTYSVNSLFKLSNYKTLTKLGTISYGLYCLHFIGILIATNLTKKAGIQSNIWVVLVIDTSIALFLTILIAKVTYVWYEKPFLNLKKRFSFITMDV